MSRTPLIIGLGVAAIYLAAYFLLYQNYLGLLAADREAGASLVERGFSANAVAAADGPAMPFLLALLRFPLPALWTLLGGSIGSVVPVLLQALGLGGITFWFLKRRERSA